ncbi:MAG: 30S ribosomal protein S16 [Patescibacteria group bacterium]
MLAIKLRRVGKKGQGSFRIVVKEARSKMVGRFTDDLGWFNPHTDKLVLDEERAKHWISVGAQPTDSVHNLLIRTGVIHGAKIAVHSKKKGEAETPKEAPTSTPAPASAVELAPQISA